MRICPTLKCNTVQIRVKERGPLLAAPATDTNIKMVKKFKQWFYLNFLICHQEQFSIIKTWLIVTLTFSTKSVFKFNTGSLQISLAFLCSRWRGSRRSRRQRLWLRPKMGESGSATLIQMYFSICLCSLQMCGCGHCYFAWQSGMEPRSPKYENPEQR